MQPGFTGLLRRPLHFLAFGFGAGLAPKAPGTFGTLVALPVYLLLQLPASDLFYLITVVIMALLGIPICGRTAKDIGVHDHGGIVWDEITGFLVALIALPAHWLIVILAFALFRLFDILKPWPISWLDKNVQGGPGIMLDDIVAGLFSCAILHLLLALGWLPVG